MGRLLLEQSNGINILRIRAVATAVIDSLKNSSVGWTAPISHKHRNNLTDANRNTVVGLGVNGKPNPDGFLVGNADWFCCMDDDTVMPELAISKLLSLGREFVAGIYYTGGKDTIPIAYVRNPDTGLYESLGNYPKGALVPVDGVGMGCTLIHRSVYEKIMKEHVLVQRQNGTLFPVHKSKVKGEIPTSLKGNDYIKNGIYHAPVQQPTQKNYNWPFYALEYGRTEDLHFCELAENVGFQPYIDTTIVCDHLKLGPVNEETFKKYRREVLDGIKAITA